jgi:hypothetical protein
LGLLQAARRHARRLGYDEEGAQARTRLTELELHCPPKLHNAAAELVNQLEGWAFGGKPIGGYRAARKEFVGAFHLEL